MVRLRKGTTLYYKGRAAADAEEAAAVAVKTTDPKKAMRLMKAAELAAEIAALDTMPDGYLLATPEDEGAAHCAEGAGCARAAGGGDGAASERAPPASA